MGIADDASTNKSSQFDNLSMLKKKTNVHQFFSSCPVINQDNFHNIVQITAILTML